MAIIGDTLFQPDDGWKRYDDTDSRFKYIGSWTVFSNNTLYNGSGKYNINTNISGEIVFRFIGTKFRLLLWSSLTDTNLGTDNKVYINGVLDSLFSCKITAGASGNRLLYEKLNLPYGEYEVRIVKQLEKSIIFDALDIDINGELVHPIFGSRIKQSINNLSIGDVIPCRYTALTSGKVGFFSELGTTTAPEIPVTSSATPDGSFYFIHSGYDHLGRMKLIADRNIQHSISWDELNNNGLVYGNKFDINLIPILTSDTSNGLAFSSDITVGYETYKAFDKNPNTRWATLEGTASSMGYLGYKFNTPTCVNRIKIQTHIDCAPKDISIKASNDTTNGNDGTWTTLVSELTSNVNSTHYYDFDNNDKYLAYKLEGYHSPQQNSRYWMTIVDMEFYSKTDPYELSTRLLTGGVSATDKDNEWDKIIVESSLGGRIIPGDNLIWNWKFSDTSSVKSWTSSSTIGATRVSRPAGNPVVISDKTNSVSTSVSGGSGYRPVLLIEQTAITKYLILDNFKYKTVENGVLTTKATTSDSIDLVKQAFQFGVTNPNDFIPQLSQLEDTDKKFKILKRMA